MSDGNFSQQIRSNQRNHLVSLNEQHQRRVIQQNISFISDYC